MPALCLYFEVHQPYRLRPFHFFDIAHAGPGEYFDEKSNRQILDKVAEKCYIPATELFTKIVKKYAGDVKLTFSLSGTILEQLENWRPDVLDRFKRLVDTGHIEILSETYYHSLAALFSDKEFEIQVRKHLTTVRRIFGVRPESFRNTELIYSNHIAYLVARMGFRSILMEGADRILDWRSPNFMYRAKFEPSLKVMTKNYQLSDDIAFRFGNRSWNEWPLTVEKFAGWAHDIAGNGEVLNLFMDYETFGEHQWADTGIFQFLEDLPAAIFKHPDFRFATVSECARRYGATDSIDTVEPISWADTERDVSAWLGNSMQREAIHALYDLRDDVYARGDAVLLDAFGRLSTSDHFYYMCTKYFNDGDVHKYFSPYETPHEAYVYFMNALHDLRETLHPASHGDSASKLASAV